MEGNDDSQEVEDIAIYWLFVRTGFSARTKLLDVPEASFQILHCSGYFCVLFPW